MPHDVVGGLVGGEDDGVGVAFVETGDLTDRLDEGTSQAEEAEVVGDGQRPGGRILGHACAPARSIRLIGGYHLIDYTEEARWGQGHRRLVVPPSGGAGPPPW